MSLLKAIEEAKAVVSSLEALLGESVSKEQVAPWYLNIPVPGVMCYVDDEEHICRSDLHNKSSAVRRIFSFDEGEFVSIGHTGMSLGYNYAIPVDPKLRLPNGQIFLT